jgi:predicted nuclease of restriction endonuclease-like RecB superfamily
MLTSDLVRVRTRAGKLTPNFIDATRPELVSLASTIISIFERYRDRARYRLDSELKDFQASGTAFLLHRGLAKLLYDRCEFETETDREPEAVRRAVFQRAAHAYSRTDQLRFDRNAVLLDAIGRLQQEGCIADSDEDTGENSGENSDAAAEKTTQETELTPEAIERFLYADLKDAQILRTFKTCTPDWLLQRYNVAVVQAVLLKATSLDVELRGGNSARYRELFRKMKFFQLLHEIVAIKPGTYRIHLDGPLSIFRSSQRYGLQIAQFFPALLHFESWKVDAELLWGPRRREVRFRLDNSSGLKPVTQSTGQWAPREMSWLETQFARLKSDWTISTDGEIVDLGSQGVLTPDYVFEHADGTRATMEILGYWRRGSVESRLELLRQHGPENLILALGRDLHVDEESVQEFPGEVYVFRSAPVAREILKILEGIRGGKGA